VGREVNQAIRGNACPDDDGGPNSYGSGDLLVCATVERMDQIAKRGRSLSGVIAHCVYFTYYTLVRRTQTELTIPNFRFPAPASNTITLVPRLP